MRIGLRPGAEASAPLVMTQQFGEYRLARLMGEGGMAQVWSAERQTIGGTKSCAVKIIRPDLADDPHYREMFQREARLSLSLSGHGNVVTVFDVGVHEGRAYLAMELVDGMTLTELSRLVTVNGAGPWSVSTAVYVVAGVLRALCHIHGYKLEGKPQGIVHRDVTPHNVMISSRGEVKLMDFGIAQRADAEPCLGGALGKLAYVPREQVEGDPDQRADLYAAGALLFELLDGRHFRWHCADEDAFFLEIYRNRVPSLRRKDVPREVNEVLRGLLQPDRVHRIASAAEALRMLEAWSGFRWALSELEATYAAATASRPRAPDSDRSTSRAASGRGPWSDSRPAFEADEPSDRDGSGRDGHGRNGHGRDGRARWETTDPQAESPQAECDALAHRRRRTVSVPVWADHGHDQRDDEGAGICEGVPVVPVTDELPGPDELATRLLPAAERNPELGDEPMERVATRRHPAALVERNVPTARTSAEIAVTKPTPSRHAPWAEGTDAIAQRLVRPEPGAPVARRRVGSDGRLGERTGSVAPRARESASMHRAAPKAAVPGVVAGEIVTDERLEDLGEPVWRVSSR